MADPVRVLVVDDSAFARKVIREVLSGAPDLEVVGIARDGLDALEKIEALDPDVVTLDLVMPGLDGVGVLKQLAGRERPRCVVVSMSDVETELGVAALDAGAIDVVKKPTALATEKLYELSDELVEKVRIAAGARPARARPRSVPPRDDAADHAEPHLGGAAARVVAIGASTGGPQALSRILAALPASFPAPILIALHMPVGYTEAFARRLDTLCAIEVREAEQGLPLAPGRAIVGRAGAHLVIGGSTEERVASLAFAPVDKPHRPSVDVLFESVAAAYGAASLAVVLTGMGSDGLLGAHAVKRAGGAIFIEAESSCVVYGMPRVVAEAGLASRALPLERIAAALIAAV